MRDWNRGKGHCEIPLTSEDGSIQNMVKDFWHEISNTFKDRFTMANYWMHTYQIIHL